MSNKTKNQKASVKEEKKQKELYENLAKIKDLISTSLTKLADIDSCGNLAEAAFTAGKAFVHLNNADNKLEEILEEMYAESDLVHWDDVIEREGCC